MLHLERKKVEAERIDEENLLLLNKITNVKATMTKKRLDLDFQRYTQYK